MKLAIVTVLVATVVTVGPPTDASNPVQQVLQRWTTREIAHEQIAALGPRGITDLFSVATDDSQQLTIRRRAITLLPTFNDENLGALATLETVVLKAKLPVYRCFAIQSLGEMGRSAVPVVVEALDDDSVCMQMSSSHDATFDVYVSDEAVRILEMLTRYRLEQEQPTSQKPHRNKDVWRTWWTENRESYCKEEMIGCRRPK